MSKTQAQKKADEYRLHANTVPAVELIPSITVAELVEHYQERELGEDADKALKVIKAYRYIFTNYVIPRWGSATLSELKAVAVEDWLKSLKKANGTRAKIREVFGAAFRHAMR